MSSLRKIAVIGLGYVGFPVAVSFSRLGKVICYDVDKKRVAELKKGHDKALANKWIVTDDASLFEKLDWPVKVLESPPSNIKVTTPFDLILHLSFLL